MTGVKEYFLAKELLFS